MSADTWIEKQWAETDSRPCGELLAELKSLRARLAEAERERDEARRERHMFLDRAASLAGKVEAALRRAEDGDMAQCLANYRAIRRAALAPEGK